MEEKKRCVLDEIIEFDSRPTPRMLPVFKGFTVDIRLRQFRKMEYGKLPEFIPFDSPRGEDLIADIFREKFGEVKDPIQAMRITHLLQRIGFF